MSRAVASFLGAGLLLRRLTGNDRGSGTVASLLAYPFAVLAGRGGLWLHAVVAAALVIASLIASRPFVSDGSDPNWVVIDEAAGTFVATLGLGFPASAVAWFVFRLADIQKGWFPGVAAADRLPGPLGVTADDLVAAVYGLAIGWVVQAAL